MPDNIYEKDMVQIAKYLKGLNAAEDGMLSLDEGRYLQLGDIPVEDAEDTDRLSGWLVNDMGSSGCWSWREATPAEREAYQDFKERTRREAAS